MKKLRAGIIGCGFIAKGKHLPGLARMEDVEIVAFCDIVIEKAQALAREYGPPDALVCLDYRDVLAREDIDVVHVCTPNSSHAEITVAALKSGKHVMCEKPMAKTSAKPRPCLMLPMKPARNSPSVTRTASGKTHSS
jgi:predicted dehydrogenase